jgi:hypothetical protein
VAGHRPGPAFANGRVLPGLPNESVPLHKLRARLAARRWRPTELDAIWAHLVIRARCSHHPQRRAAWTVGCVGVGMPDLAAVAARHAIRYRGDAADIEAAALAAWVAELRRTDICIPHIPRRLRAAADRAARAVVDTLHTTRPATSPSPTPPSATTPSATTPSATTRSATTRPGPAMPPAPPPLADRACRPTPAVMPQVKPAAWRSAARGPR